MQFQANYFKGKSKYTLELLKVAEFFYHRRPEMGLCCDLDGEPCEWLYSLSLPGSCLWSELLGGKFCNQRQHFVPFLVKFAFVKLKKNSNIFKMFKHVVKNQKNFRKELLIVFDTARQTLQSGIFTLKK